MKRGLRLTAPRIIGATLLALLPLSASAEGFDAIPPDTALSAAAVTGRWLTESGNFEVDIAPCGPALCGTVVRVLGNRSMSNPQVELQAADTRPTLGMTILTRFTPVADSEWLGEIYNREDGKTYSCVMTLVAPTQLKLRAYKGVPLFGKTQMWRRVAQTAEPAR